jgi:RNA polymerase sigma factor (sigma-70 family)
MLPPTAPAVDDRSRPSERAGGAEQAALEQLIRDYGRLIRHAIWRAGGAESVAIADDIEQNVIVNLWQQIAREQTIEHAASYVYKAAIRETVRAVRRERARSGAGPLPERVSATTGDPEAVILARERREALTAALASLAPDRGRAVRAHLGGWSVQELMGLTGWSYQRARNLVARGMADLRAALIARGVQ